MNEKRLGRRLNLQQQRDEVERPGLAAWRRDHVDGENGRRWIGQVGARLLEVAQPDVADKDCRADRLAIDVVCRVPVAGHNMTMRRGSPSRTEAVPTRKRGLKPFACLLGRQVPSWAKV